MGRRNPVFLCAIFVSFVVSVFTAHAAPLSGTKSVGPTGDYASLTAAIADVQAQTLGGALVLELQATYVSTVETFPLTIPALNGASAVNTLTIRPAMGATGLSISSADTTAATVDLNGAQFVTIDGRAGGFGTAKHLAIANTSTSGVALRLINEASSNTVEYVTLRGVNTSASSGTVVFSTTTGANGNDNNTIDRCDIGDGASTPTNGIYALGSASTTAKNNSGNTVSNCNVFNFYAATAVDSAGVRLDGGNTDWILTGNSFYQTANRAAVAANVRAIFINEASGNNFAVTGNFIGGSAANAGGTPWTTTGTAVAYVFMGIHANVNTITPSSVQGNVIGNIVWTTGKDSSSGYPGVWNGIYVSFGSVDIGTITGNTVGSGTGTGSISVTNSVGGGLTAGIIAVASAGPTGQVVIISNNIVGSITTNGIGTSVSASLSGIVVNDFIYTISGNIVGSATTANSLNAATSSISSTAQNVFGISCNGIGGSTFASITGNTVANVNNNYAGTSGISQTQGIATSFGGFTITGNTVRNLSTTSQNSSVGSQASLIGIAQGSSYQDETVSQNIVHSLSNTAASGAVTVTGIYYLGPFTGTNLIARNLVHSLSCASTSTASVVNGMLLENGTFNAMNNMVRVGLDASGAGTAGASSVYGIRDYATDAFRGFYGNSVYVGGTETSGSRDSAAFHSRGTSNTRFFQNNIFFNARDNSGGTGKHYAVEFTGTTGSNTSSVGLTCNNNIFFTSGAAGVLGLYNGADEATLAAWQAATTGDAASAAVDPRFVNPAGTAATGDLHLQTRNPAAGKGSFFNNNDFDGQNRLSFSSDIGADANNFTYSAASTELAPVISFVPLTDTLSTANRAITGFATITDDVSVAGGANAPRLYYKKATEADAFGGNTSASNGWKFATASNASSPYDFTINYGLLTGGSVAVGDSIQYFVAAQDGANNFVSSPAGAAYFNPAAPVTTVNAKPATVNSYRIMSTDLSALTLSGGTLSPAFAAGTTSYTASVPFAVNGVLVNAAKTDPAASVAITGGNGLAVGANAITIGVTSSDGSTTKIYTVTVTRLSNNANLANLALDAGTLAPAFAGGTTSYSANVSNATATLTVTPTLADGTATVTVNGGSPATPVALNVGVNTITVLVTAQDSTTKTYTVTVTRLSNNADLANLALSAGTLAPVFASGTTSYSANVSNATATLMVTPTLADSTATVTVNGGSPATPVALNVGVNTVTVLVTAQDSTTKTYTVTVTRLSNNANLANLTLSAGTLAPVFASGTTSYSANVSNATATLMVTPTLADSTATVTVNGGSPATPVALNVGVNTVTVLVTAQDSTTKTYTMTVTRLYPAGPMSGTRIVGPTGDYASVTAAIADVQTGGNGLGGAFVLELQATYVSTVETFPLTIPALNGASAANTLTIRPATGATALSISSADTTAATVDLNGAQFVTIDGRPGGTGSNAGSGGGGSSQLTIANTSTGGVALRFINEASGNTLRYTTLRGVNTSSTSGTVVFSTTTGANGNDNDTIDHCDIRDGATTPTNGLYSSGSTGTTAQYNSGNTVSNCNVFNFYTAISSTDVAGVRLDGGNTDWSITGNSFYQTSTRTATPLGNVRPIYINNNSGNNFTVTGNFIGGSAPNAGGTPWTTTVSATYRLLGIQLNVGTGPPSSVQGNTIQNIVWTAFSISDTALPGVWSGIYVQAGSANIGTVTGNTIGSGTGTGSVSITNSGDGAGVFGIGSASSGTVAIANNTIGSITTNGTVSSSSTPLTGIQITAGANTVSNNLVGSTTTANSLNAANSSTSITGQLVTGIFNSSGTSASITGNTVANLNNNYSGTATTGQIRGIVSSAGLNTITANTVRNLSTTSQNTGGTTTASVLGIIQTSTTAGQTMSQNTVHSLANTATSADVGVTGIYFSGPTSGTNFVARNLVHSLAVSSTSASSVLNGIQLVAGAFTAQNNMVRVGLDATGAGTGGASTVRGIYDNGNASGRNFYHNSVYLGGTQTSGTNNTFAFTSSASGNTRAFRNNIFVNARGNSGGTGKHYAVQYGGTTVNPTGLTATNNIFLANGSGGVFGFFLGADRTTLAGWQSATGVDALSLNVNPLFANPTGNAAAMDLHVQAASPADANAAAIAGVTDDFDGQVRNTTVPDIGADEIAVADIAVEQPSGTNLTDGVSSVGFGAVKTGGNAVRTFIIRNAGDSNLSIGSISLDGANASDFSVDITGMSTVVAPGVSTSCTVTFSPTMTGSETAALHIVSNDPNETPFDIIVTGFGSAGTLLSGTRTVGPSGTYPSIGIAIGDIQISGLGGAFLLELQVGYVSTAENFPLTISALNGASAVNTVTIRPASDATALVITSADATAATVDLNGAQFVTIDGRPGGVGSNAGSGGGAASQLTIANTSTSGRALRFLNEASGNAIRYTTLRSVNVSLTSGTVVFSTTTGANGNDGNMLDHCDISDGATTPVNGLYALGTTTTAAQNNSGNTVSNCNIFNFYSANTDSAGVRLDGGNTDWILTGNSFYQTAGRAAVNASVRVIYLNTPSGGNFTVTGNFIGGDSPGASVGTQKWTTVGTAAAYLFQGIALNVGSANPSSVQGNFVANIAWTTSSTATTLPGLWSGIYVQGGAANVGTLTGNIIGNGTGTGSVSVTTSGTGGTSFGMGSGSSGTIAIANNTIGSLTVNGTTTAVSASFTGISVGAGANTVSNNVVGSNATPSSLNAATASTSTTGQQVTGILNSSSTSAGITGNMVANLNNNYAGTTITGQIRGIVTSAGVNTITGNTVRNLSTTSQNADASSSQSAYGIIDTSATAGQSMTQNTVHSLGNTAASAAVSVTGIYYSGPTSGTNVVARNLVHSLTVSSSSVPSVLSGMQFVTGTFTAQNNMVRVGLDANGAGTGGASTVRGIYDNGSTVGRNFFHNSVYLGGTQTSGTNNTFAFDGSTGVSNVRAYQNNAVVNARGNGGGNGKHYAVQYGGAGVNPTGLTAGGNLIYAPNTAGSGVLGFYNGADRATMTAWQAALGQDAASFNLDPLFVAPSGTAATVDLHLQASNPAEGGGVIVAAVTDDFDGQARNTLTPVDIGADAGNFTASVDLFAPTVSYRPLTNGSTVNRVLTGWATITDAFGVAGGANAPRLYFRKGTDADIFGGANDSTGNGWKYVTATGSGPYSFALDYSLLYNSGGGNGSVTVGDTIQYFVVAQDAANNLGSSPGGAAASANPPIQSINSHGIVNSFSIIGTTISGTKTVGAGGDFPSLSGAGGLFAALNGAVLTGDVVVKITSDVIETGGVTLSEFNGTEYPAVANYTLTIQPDSATMRTISGNVNGGLITLNGADRVTIDGRFGGSGRFLTFRNTSAGTSAGTVRFINDSSNNTVRNCIVEGATTNGSGLGVIGFGAGTITGNDNNLITGCQVRDLSTAVGVPMVLIGSSGSSAAVANSGNTVSNNELFNYNSIGLNITSTGNDSWTLSGNTIYEANAATANVYGIMMQGGGFNTITGNFIHDLLTATSQSIGIYFLGDGTTTIARNRITALNVSGSMTTVYGVVAQGNAASTLNVANNQIALIPTAPVSSSLFGVYDFGSSDSVVNVFCNTVIIGGTESGTSNSKVSVRRVADTHIARDNIFLNLRTGGTGSHYAAGIEGIGGSYTASNNVYAGTGATAANFMDFSGTAGIGVPVSFATWQSATGDTGSQGGIAGTGSFTTAMFINAATGDLHLVPGGNALVNALGTSIPGVTDDYDGDPRLPNTPTIGADEIFVPDVAVAQTAALTDGAGSVDFGTVTLGGSSAVKTFTITNPGNADLTALAFTTKDGTNPGDFTVTALSGTTVPASGGSVTFTVTFTPGASGARSAAIHVASNVNGAKNPFDIALTGTGQTVFQAWVAANGVASDPNAVCANGQKNLVNFAFGLGPATGGGGPLAFNGTVAGGGTVGAIGLPLVWVEPTGNGTGFSALFVQRKDAALAGLIYTVEFSADVTTWSASATAPTVLADDGTYQIMAVPYPPLVNGAQARFSRVRVTLAP